MAILAQVQTNGTLIPVEVTDTFTTSDGRKLAAVRAINGGKPFTTWTHGGPCPDDRATYRADLLQNVTVTVEDDPKAANLFKRAVELAANKRQWYAGEIVYIWGDQRRGAFLAEDNGVISLYVTGHRKPCRLFYLALDGWQIGDKAAEQYGGWAAQVRAEVTK